jgi:hypothetical protein
VQSWDIAATTVASIVEASIVRASIVGLSIVGIDGRSRPSLRTLKQRPTGRLASLSDSEYLDLETHAPSPSNTS